MDARNAKQDDSATSGIIYYEDLIDAPIKRFGPLIVGFDLLDQLLDLMGEKHPIHASDKFAEATPHRKRIVPGGFIHSMTSGWMVRHDAPAAVLGLKNANWDFVRPLYPDTPFFFTSEVEHMEEIDQRLGLVKSVRRVFDEAGKTLAIGRISVVMSRRAVAERNHLDEQ